ncbi:alpha/beta hydrolase [Candidatus Pelagisphaera phototrophica]|uniref:alpha/beta hydrolase n=1 Tax=Candidatus Pelagisphaera phototrophica TaxID=2684113 RepID=UPI0019ED7093|nr:alpha/beta hydrolase [Candidatus Pelagisphaera phototrophica]QXD32632.1 alpha/beta hydrolase [Candidatus Pelagisphaera phototrophica]
MNGYSFSPRFIRWLILGLISQACAFAAPTILKDIEYARPNGYPLLLDLYLPERAQDESVPVVLWVHGGGWKNGSKEKAKAAWLAEEGYAVVSINYRLTDVAQWPAQIDDCREAVRWARRNSSVFGFDLDRIGTWGSSAGGHLVALMGTLPYPENESVSSRVQAVCDWFGPTELLTMPPNNVGEGRTEEDVANSNGAKLLGCTVKDCPELARQASAYDNVSKDDAPFLIMHGDEDPGVPIQQSIQFYDRLRKTGVPVQYEVVEGAGHGGKLFDTPEVKAIVRAFFYQYLKRR